MSHKILTFSILFINCFGYSQSIKGRIIDAESKESIPHVNIGILHKKIGTVSDTNGNFTLQLVSIEIKDTLKISCIGYEPFIIPLHFASQDLYTKNTIIELAPKPNELEEVVITAGTYKTEIVGNKIQHNLIVTGLSTKNRGAEFGTVLKYNHKKPGFIKDINLNIAQSNFDSLIFRVNLYTLKEGIPSESILNKPIYLKTKVKYGVVTLDVSQENISIKGDSFLSIEWIEDLASKSGISSESSQLWLSGGFLKNDSYVRFTSQSDWEKVAMGLGIWATVKYKK